MPHILTIPGWHPARVNQLYQGHWTQRRRLKARDKKVVAAHALLARIPKATGKRRVSLGITLGPRQRADPDSFHKSLLDALVAAGLIVNDSSKWVELGPVTFDRDKTIATTVTLEDLE